MAIAPQPDSPPANLLHGDYKDKINEVIEQTNLMTDPPKINLQITQLYTNDHTVTATDDEHLEVPAGLVPTTTPIGDALLNSYIPVENITGADSDRITQSGYDFEVSISGEYLADGFAVFIHTQNNTDAGFTFSLERGGNWIFSPRVVRNTMANGDSPTLLAGSGLLNLVAGDKLRLWLAASKSGDVTVDTMSIRLRRIGN